MSGLISILSTDHGRLRREQRDISKRDLYKALRLGTKERCWGQRWKIEYDGIIFIVDKTMSVEVTAFPSPLALAPVDAKGHILHNRTRDLLERKPELCTSHTVLVVDTSGSMTKHDINLHRDRQVAAYSVTAMEFVAEQLFKQTATNSDVVSVIEFDTTAREVLSREPFSWTLYNKLLDRRDSRTFKTRGSAGVLDALCGDTNYIPALEAADKALRFIDHDRCALSLLFLSDGSPTDSTALNVTPLAAKKLMAAKITEMAQRHEEKLNIQMIGFGSASHDFSVLEDLIEAAQLAQSGTVSKFTYCGKIADRIGTAVSSLASSTAQTRTQLLGHDRGKTRTRREVTLESDVQGDTNFNYYKILEHYIYNPGNDCFGLFPDVPPGAVAGSEVSSSRHHYDQEQKKKIPTSKEKSEGGKELPPLLAISWLPYGQGAERLAFRCHLARATTENDFAFNPMVAKETILVERPDDNVQFHEDFCKTQSLAAYLALEFNNRLVALPWNSKTNTPQIIFLPCSVLVLDDPEWRDRGVLVEKKMNVEKYGWRKYNDNAGGLDGKRYHAPINVEREFAKFAKLDTNDCMIIQEGSEEEDSSSDDEGTKSGEEDSDTDARLQDNHQDSTKQNDDQEMVDPTEYIHAFTHFSYLFTNRQAMVCDLQGVYNSDMIPPTFELTDPAIHYRSRSGKSNVFGRTDLGEDGMDLFFDTHHCNQVCKLMRLSRKNKSWQKQWRGRPL